jgi:hypothetical protein
VVGRVGEEHEDLVGGDRQRVLGVHLRVEPAGDLRVDFERPAPGGQLDRERVGPWDDRGRGASPASLERRK